MKPSHSTQPPLGIPCQIGGMATLQSDRGDETQALFVYQWVAGVVCLSGALSGANNYQAIWCEHHDDMLAELAENQYHAIQVKTLSAQGSKWKCSDAGFIDAVRKFADHESKYSAQIPMYIFFSNAKPYVPAETAHAPSSLASSPMRLHEACNKAASPEDIEEPYAGAFRVLRQACGIDAKVLFEVLRKLAFQQGPPLDGFRDHILSVIGGIPTCRKFTLEWLMKIRDELLWIVGKASSVSVTSIDFYGSILQSDGRPAAVSRSKRISTDDFETVIQQSPSGSFRYAEVGGHLKLGAAAGQKNVLRRKMQAGFVGAYFDSIWLQALAAERRLMERALQDPESIEQTLEQLEGVMTVECQNAEATAALETDERRRGLMIYQRILVRTDELAKCDNASVENERPETLRGIAGLLSGSCKFAWGVPPESEDENGA